MAPTTYSITVHDSGFARVNARLTVTTYTATGKAKPEAVSIAYVPVAKLEEHLAELLSYVLLHSGDVKRG